MTTPIHLHIVGGSFLHDSRVTVTETVWPSTPKIVSLALCRNSLPTPELELPTVNLLLYISL